MSYQSLVRIGPGFFLPLGLLARLPYAMTPLATLLMVQSATNDLAFAGIVVAVQSIGLGVAGMIIGSLADRFGARRAGAAAAILSALAILALIASAHHAEGSADFLSRLLIMVSSALVGLTYPGTGLLIRAHWSVTLRRRERLDLLPTARAWESVADEISFVAGPAMVGLLAVRDPVWGLAASAAILAGATVPLTLGLAQTTDRPEAPMVATTTGGPGGAAHERLPVTGTTALLVGMTCIGVVFGSTQIAVARFAADSGRPGEAGLLYALLGVGSAGAGLAQAWLPDSIGWRVRYAGSAVGLLAGCLVLLAGVRTALPIMIAVLVAGFGVSPYLIALFGAVERIMPGRRYTTGLAIVCAGSAVGSAGGQFAGGQLARQGASDTVLLAVSASVLAVFVAVLFTRVIAPRRGPRTRLVRASTSTPAAGEAAWSGR
jgi:MFS family permease